MHILKRAAPKQFLCLREVKAGKCDIIPAVIQVFEKIGEQSLIPFAADFIQSDIECFFFLLVQVHHHAVDFLVAEVLHDFEPLMPANDRSCSLIPYHWLDIAKLLDAPFELLIFGIAGLEVFPRIIWSRFQLYHRSLFYLHLSLRFFA